MKYLSILIIFLFLIILYFSYYMLTIKSPTPIQSSINLKGPIITNYYNQIYGVFIPKDSYDDYNNFKLSEGIMISDNLLTKYISDIYSQYLYNMNVVSPIEFYNGKQLNLQFNDGNAISIKYDNIKNYIIYTKNVGNNIVENILYKVSKDKEHIPPLGMFGSESYSYGERLFFYEDNGLLMMRSLKDNYTYIVGEINEYLELLNGGEIISINPQYKIQYKNGNIINLVDNSESFFIY